MGVRNLKIWLLETRSNEEHYLFTPEHLLTSLVHLVSSHYVWISGPFTYSSRNYYGNFTWYVKEKSWWQYLQITCSTTTVIWPYIFFHMENGDFKYSECFRSLTMYLIMWIFLHIRMFEYWANSNLCRSWQYKFRVPAIDYSMIITFLEIL